MFTFSPNQNLIASLPITVSTPTPSFAAAIFVACWMVWVIGREWFWRLVASRLVAHLVRLFLSFKEYKERKRLLVLRLNIKVAVVRRTLLLVGGGGERGGEGVDSTFPLFFTKNFCHRYPPNPVSFPDFGESRFSGSSQIPSLRANSPGGALWRRGGKRKESLQLCLWNLNFTSKSPVAPRRLSCQISANQRECKQTLKTRTKGNDVITNVVSANQHFSI